MEERDSKNTRTAIIALLLLLLLVFGSPAGLPIIEDIGGFADRFTFKRSPEVSTIGTDEEENGTESYSGISAPYTPPEPDEEEPEPELEEEDELILNVDPMILIIAETDVVADVTSSRGSDDSGKDVTLYTTHKGDRQTATMDGTLDADGSWSFAGWLILPGYYEYYAETDDLTSNTVEVTVIGTTVIVDPDTINLDEDTGDVVIMTYSDITGEGGEIWAHSTKGDEVFITEWEPLNSGGYRQETINLSFLGADTWDIELRIGDTSSLDYVGGILIPSVQIFWGY